MRYLVFWLFILCPGHLFSQTDASDLQALNDSASYYYDHGNFDRAWAIASQARSEAETHGPQQELFRSYTLLGGVAIRRGHLKKAEEFHRNSLIIARSAKEVNWQGKALSNLASMLSQRGAYDSAELLLKEAISLGGVDPEILISSYGRLGANLKRQQEYDQAIGYYVRSLALSQEKNDSLASARTLANIGNIYMEQKDASQALDYYHKALFLLDSGRNSLSISGITVFASDALQAMGRYDEAEQYLRRSLALIVTLNLPASEAYALESLGILHFNRRKVQEAISVFNRALDLQRSLDSWSGLESVLLQLTECYIHTGQFRKAQVTLQEGKLIAEQHRHAFGLRNVYKLMSRLDSAQGDFRSRRNSGKNANERQSFV